MYQKLLGVFGIAFTALVAVLAFPIMAANTGLVTVGRAVPEYANGLISWTFAQTLTLSELSTETGTIVTTNVPSLAVFIAFAVVIALAAFLVGRLIRAGKA